jgi:hypothetical protein
MKSNASSVQPDSASPESQSAHAIHNFLEGKHAIRSPTQLGYTLAAYRSSSYPDLRQVEGAAL